MLSDCSKLTSQRKFPWSGVEARESLILNQALLIQTRMMLRLMISLKWRLRLNLIPMSTSSNQKWVFWNWSSLIQSSPSDTLSLTLDRTLIRWKTPWRRPFLIWKVKSFQEVKSTSTSTSKCSILFQKKDSLLIIAMHIPANRLCLLVANPKRTSVK